MNLAPTSVPPRAEANVPAITITRALVLAVQVQEAIEDGNLGKAHSAAVEIELALEELRDAA